MSRSALPVAFLAALLLAAGPAPVAMANSPQCADGEDNDGDEHVDYPSDTDCASPNDDSEVPECSDGVDNDGDGSTDHAEDPGCSSPDDWSEEWPPSCADGQDDDYDGHTDWPEDQDCRSPDDPSEAGPDTPSCADGLDNDGDGPRDYPRDPDCATPYDHSEATCEPAPIGCVVMTPCPGAPLPPLFVQASRDDQGVHVTWEHSPAGIPDVYRIYRVSIPDPAQVDAESILLDLTTPHDAVDGSQTAYLDALASAAGTYVYWVTAAGPGCQSMPSNAAPSVGGIPDLSDCVTIDKDQVPPITGPSTVCLNGWP